MSEFKEQLEVLRTVNERREHSQDLVEDKRALMETRINELCAKLDDQENRSKRNNIIFFGIENGEREDEVSCEETVNKLLKDKLGLTDVKFDRVHRLGNKQTAPIIARCTFYKQKLDILKRRTKLRGTKIYINEDYSKNIRDVRQKINELTKADRENKKRVNLVYDHVYIDDKKFVLSGDRRTLVEANR